MPEIWTADVTFFYKQNAKEKEKKAKVKLFIVKAVIVKRIPLRFLLNEGDFYIRATRDMLAKTMLNELENDKNTGLKKFTITYNKLIEGL